MAKLNAQANTKNPSFYQSYKQHRQILKQNKMQKAKDISKMMVSGVGAQTIINKECSSQDGKKARASKNISYKISKRKGGGGMYTMQKGKRQDGAMKSDKLNVTSHHQTPWSVIK